MILHILWRAACPSGEYYLLVLADVGDGIHGDRAPRQAPDVPVERSRADSPYQDGQDPDDSDFVYRQATALGLTGWVGNSDQGVMVEAEGDPSSIEELIETLEVYLGAKQNIREAARRLHLAPRTVAYRLERIESLLGSELEGETVVRVSAALVALRQAWIGLETATGRILASFDAVP